ncbi:hypothetical protein TeGR_g3870 [Tetraparma gracilis]|uniref:V-SNARE coiled-coil homology domain-containing protein n=1 Tax=Tetraparma gracilis TaxID=2962635 RepID=A0ABQ6MBY8_9STRA|nr:hypothetical protein TeGR_g3870 [Tetraparma gracilis]
MLLHTLICARSQPIAESDLCPSSAMGLLETIASKTLFHLDPEAQEDQTITVSVDERVVHVLVRPGPLVYLVLTSGTSATRTPPRVAFQFLYALHRSFSARYADKKALKASRLQFKSFSSVATNLLQLYSTNPPAASSDAKIGRIHDELGTVKNVMHKNIEAVLHRGDRIESLVDKSHELTLVSEVFKRSSSQVLSNMRRRNLMYNVIVASVVIVIVLFLGITMWQPGRNKSS